MSRDTRPRPVGLRLLVCVLCAALPGLTGCARTVEAAGSAAPRIDRELALATFDSAWSRINHTYYDPDFRGLDWAAVREELRPGAAAAASLPELRTVITEMLGRIGESHFAPIPVETADALPPGWTSPPGGGVLAEPGLQVRVLAEGVVVTVVEGGSPAATAGVQPGRLIEAVGDRATEGWLRALGRLSGPAERRVAEAELVWRVSALLQGPPGSTVEVRFRDGRARTETAPAAH